MRTIPPNPFKGLRPYKQEDQDKLFGRDRDLILMKDRVFSARTTLLFAGSGVGKTSFLNAKLIPDLKKQCCVVWHNRWTGTEEQEHEEAVPAEEKGFRFWPPRALFRDVKEKLGFKRNDAGSTNSPTNAPEHSDDDLTSQVHKTIAQNLRESSKSQDLAHSLSGVLAGFRKSKTGQNLTSTDKQNNRCILILDQFEEVFQYHAFEDYFGSFVTDLCDIINNDDYQVRVVFSMREEFLGELSIFDNRIPDLFNNYYRLRYPDKDEAADIIRSTCQLSGVNPHEKNLNSLVDDLSKIEKGGRSVSKSATGSDKTRVRVIKRNFVAPPYLQIACERLWNQQYAENAPAQADSGSADSQAPSSVVASVLPFLTSYRAGNGDSAESERGGDAQLALRSFCEEKLSTPFLNGNEQDIVARAFGFLVTKQGAKMAYELRSLAEHMDERVSSLKTALEKLSQDDAKILRESRGPDRSYWFELYHDMYATIVDEWKRSYQKIKRTRDRRKLIRQVALPAMIVFLLFAVPHWIISPLGYRRTLINYRETLEGTLPRSEGDPEPEAEAQLRLAARRDYDRLSSTLGYGSYAHSLWADILERRALLFQRQERRQEALLSLLKAATLRFTSAGARRNLAQAQSLIGDDYSSLRTTYKDDCDAASLSPDGSSVLTLSKEQVDLWKADSGEHLATICSDCIQGMFSRDGKAIATLSKVNESRTSRINESRGASARLARSTNIRQSGEKKTSNSESSPAQISGVDDNQTLDKGIIQFEVNLWDTSGTAIHKPITIPVGRKTESARVDTGLKSAQREPRNLGTIQPAPPAEAPSLVPTENDDSSAVKLEAVAGNDSGYSVAATVGKAIVVARSKSGLLLQNLPGVEDFDFPPSLNLSSDGSFLVIDPVNEKTRLWKITETTAIPEKRIDHLQGGRTLAFSPDGSLFLAQHEDGKVRVWKLNTNEPPRVVVLGDRTLTRISFSSDGRQIVTAGVIGFSETVQLFDTATLQPLYDPIKFTNRSSNLQYRSEIKALLRTRVDRDYVIFEKWEPASGKLTGRLVLEGGELTSWYNPRDVSVVALSDKVVRSWTIDPIKPRGTRLQGELTLSYRGMSLDAATLLTFNGGSKMQVWNLETGKPLSDPLDRDRTFLKTLLSPQGRYVASVTQKKILNVVPVANPSSVILVPYEDNIGLITFSPDDQLMAVATSSAIYISPPAATLPPLKLPIDSSIMSMTISRDKKYITATFASDSAAGAKPLRVWTLPTGGEITISQTPSEDLIHIVFAQSKMIALDFENENVVHVWDLSSGLKQAGLPHNEHVVQVTTSPDGKRIITSDAIGVLRLWSAQTLAQTAELKLSPAVGSFVFGADPQKVLVRKGNWLHRLSFDEKGFHYLGGLIPGRIAVFRPTSPDGERIRVVRPIEDNALEILNIGFGGDMNLPDFQGTPNAILYAWGNRLALVVDEFGEILRLRG